MAYLFDTDAIAELLLARPQPGYVAWLRTVPRAEQYTSAVVAGELWRAARRAPDAAAQLAQLEARVFRAVTILPYDVAVARVFGALRARLDAERVVLADAYLQVAATALYHGLELVTRSARYARVPGVAVSRVLLGAGV